MVETALRAYLADVVDVPVYLDTPPTHGPSYVTIERVGSGRSDRLTTYRMAIQSYGSSKAEAAALNEAVKEAMLTDVVYMDDIGGIRLDSDYDYTDTSTKSYRYQAVYEVVYYDGY